MVSTRFGKTHVLVSGPEGGVPVVMLHGGNTTNPATIETTKLVFKHVNIEPEMPRNVMKEELVHFDAPTLVLAAENDCLFPPRLVIPRARQIFTNLVAAEVIPDSPHFVFPSCLPTLNQRVERFLQTGQ